MRHVNQRIVLLPLLGLMLMGQSLRGQDDAGLLEKQERQRRIREETDRMVRQMETTIRVLQFYQLEKSEERKTLEEAAQVLGRLSGEQMTEVITRLEKAANAATAEQADSEKAAAYAKHREIVAELRKLLDKRTVLRTLEDAALLLEGAARKQHDLYLTAGPIVEMILDPEIIKKASTDARGRFQERGASRSSRNVLERLADHQADLWAEVQTLLDKQLPGMQAHLRIDQKDRLTLALDLAKTLDLKGSFETVAEYLEGKNWFSSTRNPKYKKAVELQWSISANLQKVADALRVGQDKLDVLRIARDRIDEAIVLQNRLRDQTEKTEDGAANSQLMLQQGRLAQQAQEVLSHLEKAAEPAAGPLAKGVDEMLAAEKQLQRLGSKAAAELQKKAEASLQQTSKELDKAIAAEERKRSDPVAALEDAIESLDRLIDKQNEARKLTGEADQAGKPEELAKLAVQQRRLAGTTGQISQKPLPGAEDARAGLQKAERAMRDAAQSLTEQKGKEAAGQQSGAVEALKDAKQTFENKLAEVKKRQEDIALLQKSKAELENLTTQEKQVADLARRMSEAKDAQQLEQLQKELEQLMKRQGDLTPLAQELAKKQQELASLAEQLAKKQGEQNALAKEMAKQQGELSPMAQDLAKKLAKNPGESTRQMAELAEKLAQRQKELSPLAEDLAKQPGDLKQLAEQLAKKQQELAPLAEKLAKEMAQQAATMPLAEELAKRLAEQLAKEQPDLSPLAERLAKELAKQRGELTPEAKDLAKKLTRELADKQENLSPDAKKLAEQLAQQLDQLAKMPREPRPQADELAKRLAEELAKAQGKLKPQTDELAKRLAQELSPEAAKKLAESLANMRAAEKNLQERSPAPASKQADEARRRMEDAMKDVAKALDEKKLRELLEQAALNPNEISPSKAAQQVAKALEQVEGAQKYSDEAAKQLAEQLRQMREQGQFQPNGQQRAEMARLQEELAKHAEQLKFRDASLRANEAAKSLQKGDLRQALRDQSDALEELQHLAKQPGRNGLTPEQAKRALELARSQQDLFRSTRSLSESQEATAAALAALAQAQAQAPQAVRNQIEDALRQLADARNQLGEGAPGTASEAQKQAARQLMEALKDLNMTAEAMGQQPARPGQRPRAVASSREPGQERPNRDRPLPDNLPELDPNRGEGLRTPDGKTSHSMSELLKAQGKGGFIHLPERQRDLVRQALGQNLPPEYAAMIQQYYLNIAKSKARPAPRR